MERPDVMDTAQAKARQRLFRSMGAGVLGMGTSFDYGQPSENGDFLRLSLVVLPLRNQTQMQPDEVKTLVRSIYAMIYKHIPKSVYDASLGRILGSVPDEPLQIA